MNKTENKNSTMYVLLFFMLGIGSFLSLPVLVLMINTQAASYGSSNSITNVDQIGGNNNKDKGENQQSNTVKQMGICLAGAGGPCNGDSNWDGTHDVTGQCVLLNGCGSDNGYNSNKSTNNSVNGK